LFCRFIIATSVVTAGIRDEHSSSVWPAYRLRNPTEDETHQLASSRTTAKR
jgi:hypothetical protein